MAETHTSNSANGAMLSPTATQIEVGTGRFVDVANPDPATIVLEDIARALAHTCRYGGHVKTYYSVAEHAVLVHDLLKWQGADASRLRAALLHDAAEAYLGDVVAPLKFAVRREELDRFKTAGGYQSRFDTVSAHRSAYDALTDRMEEALAERFGVPAEEFASESLRTADMWALKIEAAELTHSGGAEWRWPGELPHGGELPDDVVWFGDMEPMLAMGTFLDRALKLGVA